MIFQIQTLIGLVATIVVTSSVATAAGDFYGQITDTPTALSVQGSDGQIRSYSIIQLGLDDGTVLNSAVFIMGDTNSCPVNSLGHVSAGCDLLGNLAYNYSASMKVAGATWTVTIQGHNSVNSVEVYGKMSNGPYSNPEALLILSKTKKFTVVP